MTRTVRITAGAFKRLLKEIQLREADRYAHYSKPGARGDNADVWDNFLKAHEDMLAQREVQEYEDMLASREARDTDKRKKQLKRKFGF